MRSFPVFLFACTALIATPVLAEVSTDYGAMAFEIDLAQSVIPADHEKTLHSYEYLHPEARALRSTLAGSNPIVVDKTISISGNEPQMESCALRAGRAGLIAS